MTVHAPAILAVLFALVMAGAGGALAVAAVRGVRAAGRSADAGFPWESHRGLVLLLSLLISTAAAAATLAWILLLRDLVPQWEDVRCSVGVLRVGSGARGAQGWLPSLAGWTNVLLGALLVGAGGAAAAHLAGRDRPEGPPRRAHLVWLFVVGVLAVAAASCMTAWIVIPKEGRFLSAGCCTPGGALLGMEPAPASLNSSPVCNAVWLAVSSLMFAGAWWFGGRPGDPWHFRWPGVRLIWASGVLFYGHRLIAVWAAPAVLGLPNHPCSWCLVGEAPETLWGMTLLAVPLLASAWYLAARFLGPGSGPTLDRIERTLRAAALFGLLGAPLFFAAERLAS